MEREVRLVGVQLLSEKRGPRSTACQLAHWVDKAGQGGTGRQGRIADTGVAVRWPAVAKVLRIKFVRT